MGTIAETANVDYHLSFTQPKKTNSHFPIAEDKGKFAVFIFRSAAKKRKFLLSVKYILKWRHTVYIDIYI
jgi:hypothetical protein